MCEKCETRGMGWKGWRPLPVVDAPAPAGPWFDLSHPVNVQMPRAHIFTAPRFERVMTLPKDPINVTRFEMTVHTGTHVDAPRHFFNDGPAFDEIPLDRLNGPGVVIHFDTEPGGVIEVEDFQRSAAFLWPGDIVALHTGWSDRFGTKLYDVNPSISVDAAHWLVERGVKLLACDFATPDLALPLRKPGFDWPVHQVLLSNGVLVCEHIIGIASLAGKRVEFVFGALNITAADGAPARVLARLSEAIK
jgi:kynurenine formamidase